jgi:hypothetical protein
MFANLFVTCVRVCVWGSSRNKPSSYHILGTRRRLVGGWHSMGKAVPISNIIYPPVWIGWGWSAYKVSFDSKCMQTSIHSGHTVLPWSLLKPENNECMTIVECSSLSYWGQLQTVYKRGRKLPPVRNVILSTWILFPCGILCVYLFILHILQANTDNSVTNIIVYSLQPLPPLPVTNKTFTFCSNGSSVCWNLVPIFGRLHICNIFSYSFFFNSAQNHTYRWQPFVI